MSTTTQTQEATPKTFRMPHVSRGQSVMFYPRGFVQATLGLMGHIVSVNPKNVEIAAAGRIYEGVHHKDDPHLKTNKHAREHGCWHLATRDVEVDEKLVELSDRVSKLEAILSDLK